VAELLAILTSALNARSADEGRSFFSKPGGGSRVGDKLWPDHVTMQADPGDVALSILPWSQEWLPLQAATWVERGVLTRLACSRYWAKQKGRAPVPEPAGLRLVGGNASAEELIKGVKRGVLITRFWYVNSLDPSTLLSTGLTRDGTFLIENGELVAAVNNFRFNESPHVMLERSDAMTAPVVAPDGSMRVPTLRSHEFNLSSVSEAV
jgi:predicted Zn-dependent protease